jgi:hypothetical protein
MSTRLTPTCDECGGPPGAGFLIDPESLAVRCLACAIPDESERERVTTDAIRKLMRRCEEDLGRRPESVAEFSKWVESQGARD